MANPDHVERLNSPVAEWNSWRETNNHGEVDLSGADLAGMKLNHFDLLRAKLMGANLSKTQLEYAHLTDANVTGAILEGANLEHVIARNAIFDDVSAQAANFEVATLRGATFARARLSETRFHRAYLRDANLGGAFITNSWLRFTSLDGARCQNTDFSGADLRHASLVKTDLRGANLTNVQVFGISAWSIQTDSKTRQDLIVSIRGSGSDAPLRVHDLQTAQLLALMLDGQGVRHVLDSVSSKLVLILGSFAPEEKVVLDGIRDGLRALGYVAVMFDFERPTERDYAETIVVLAGMSRFVIADFTNAKEVRSEVAQIKCQYRRVPIIPLGRKGAKLPPTMSNWFTAEEIRLRITYDDIDGLVDSLPSIIKLAEGQAAQVAGSIAEAEGVLRGEVP